MTRKHILLIALALIVGGSAMVIGVVRKTVTLQIDGEAHQRTTYALRVGDLLREVGVVVGPKDQLQPSVSDWLGEGDQIILNRATPIHIWADGQTRSLLTAERKTANLLAFAGVNLYPGDQVLLDRQPVQVEEALPRSFTNSIQVIRAVPIQIQDGSQSRMLSSTAPTLGEALWDAGITIHEADRISAPLDTPLTEPLDVSIRRSIPFIIEAGGQIFQVRSAAQTVGEVLAEVGMALQGLDYSVPAESAPPPSDGVIKVVRVKEELILEQSPLPFETVFQPDSTSEIDTKQIIEPGEYGLTAHRIRVRYEDGAEVSRQEEAEWVAVEPKPRVMGYGTQVVVRSVDTPGGPLEYWRAVNMYATSYSPCRIFKDRCSSTTASGAQLKKGIAAVVTYWYPAMKGAQVYVPGYGVATILDAGRGIPGRNWIDLGYSDDDFVNWHQWVTVYFLTPVPSPDRIVYLLN